MHLAVSLAALIAGASALSIIPPRFRFISSLSDQEVIDQQTTADRSRNLDLDASGRPIHDGDNFEQSSKAPWCRTKQERLYFVQHLHRYPGVERCIERRCSESPDWLVQCCLEVKEETLKALEVDRQAARGKC
jgi:hypothetical protein